MRVLGIETSCDDTSAAVVSDGRILSNVVSSQVAVHRPFRGVVPELASRQHLAHIVPVVSRALSRAGRGRLDAVAYTRGPGLMGPLLVGKVGEAQGRYAVRVTGPYRQQLTRPAPEPAGFREIAWPAS